MTLTACGCCKGPSHTGDYCEDCARTLLPYRALLRRALAYADMVEDTAPELGASRLMQDIMGLLNERPLRALYHDDAGRTWAVNWEDD